MNTTFRRKRSNDNTIIKAKFEAQKIAFAPISFQASKTLRDLGILKEIYNAGEKGIKPSQIASNLKITNYGVETLLEVGSVINLVEPKHDGTYIITKTGTFILNDKMTRVNMDFINDVCYQGSFFLQESISKSRPEGLKVFGEWDTIYQGLSSLPEKVKKSWFSFDHFYSDAAFNDALKIVFKDKPKNLFDLGGNTGKWTKKCLGYDKDVRITLLDLPGQLNVAKNNLAESSLLNRSSFHEIDILEENSKLPSGADVVWMSQFLDCFSKTQIISILSKIVSSIDKKCVIYVLEPFWDKQKFNAATFSLNHTSLYFTCMANGNSKMYSYKEMVECANVAGLKLLETFDDVGENEYTILKFSKK